MVEADSHLKLIPTSILYMYKVFEHIDTVHWHMVAALHSFTHPTWLSFWGSGSLAESKSCDYIMVEADGHLKLLPTSILDMYNVFEYIDMLSMGTQYHPYSFRPTLLLGSDFGFWVTCGVNMM